MSVTVHWSIRSGRLAPAFGTALGLRALFGALALSLALLVHLLLEAIAAPGVAFLNSLHLGLGVVSLTAFAISAVALGAGNRRERRLRAARMLRTLARRRTSVFAVIVLSQALIVAGTLALEGVAFDPARAGIAFVSAILATLFAAMILRVTFERVVRIIGATLPLLVCIAPRACGRRASRRSFARSTRLYELFVPTRPPPLLRIA